MFIDADDDIWVLDSAGTSHLYSNAGQALSSTHTGGKTIGPWGPYVTVWGVNTGNGTYNESFQGRADALHNGVTFPTGFIGSPNANAEAQDRTGQEYVSDATNNLIQIWTPNGLSLVATIPTPATPCGVAVDTARNLLYVSFASANEVVIYSTKAPYKMVGKIL